MIVAMTSTSEPNRESNNRLETANGRLTYSSSLLTYNYLGIGIQMSKNEKPRSRQPSREQKKSNRGENNRAEPEEEQSPFSAISRRSKLVLRRLIPSQPIELIRKLVQLGADNLKKEMQPSRLLPTLSTTTVLSELAHESSHKFQQISKQLTHGMLSFQQSINQSLDANLGEMVRLQADKCYRRIPGPFFEAELSSKGLESVLTRDRRKAQSLRDDLCDYYDEVEFNVNQQVTYKLSIFMNFVSFLGSLGGLADLSISKIKVTRAHNQVLKEMVIMRGERVTSLRRRQKEIEQAISALTTLKKMKRIEQGFMSQVHAKGKITALHSYSDYVSLHEQLKSYCCSRMLCKFWDIAYYVQRGYHDSFVRSLKNYLTEIAVIDENLLHEIAFPSKTAFATVTNCRAFSSLNDPDIGMDESFEVQEAVELVSKHNIQREIVAIYRQGLQKCSYSTDQVCQQLTQALQTAQDKLYRILRGDHSLLPSDSPLLPPQPQLSQSQKRQPLERMLPARLVRVVDHWSQRLKKVVKRELSIVERALRVTAALENEHPEKYEVMCSYLMQILYLTLSFADQSLSFMLSCRKFKTQQADSIRQLLFHEEQWKDLVSEMSHSPAVWKQLQGHFVEGITDSQSKCSAIVEALLPNLRNTRRKIVEVMVNGCHHFALGYVQKALNEEVWKAAAIPVRLYRTLGEVLFGKGFTEDLDQAELRMLSSSLLLEKNSSTYSILQTEPEQVDPPKTSEQLSSLYDLSLTESSLKLERREYKLVASTLTVVQALQGYLQWADEGDGDRTESLLVRKMEEFLLGYSNAVRQLILNKGALSLGKMSSKSITGKHLLLAYAQLSFVKKVTAMLGSRLARFQQPARNVKQKFEKHLAEVSKKFRSILELSIRQSLEKMVVDPRSQILSPIGSSRQIVQALNKSSDLVRDVLMCESFLPEFLNVNWCVLYLQKLRAQYRSVYKQIMNSSGSRRARDIDWQDNIYWKFKELDYMVTNLIELRDNLPSFNSLIEELEQERKKLQNPH